MAKRRIFTLGKAKTPDRTSIGKFVESMSGGVIIPGDHQYGGARRVWNHAVNVHPAIMARCANRDNVVRAVEFAQDRGLLTAIRSGGHSFAGHGVCEGGMMIDLCSMKRAEIDPLAKTITMETGVIAGELDCLTQAFKLAVPLGSCPSVGVAGYSLGGGEGSLMPKLGYGCDSITRIEVVTADGRVRVAGPQENADLFGRCAARERISVLRRPSSLSCIRSRPFFPAISNTLFGRLNEYCGLIMRLRFHRSFFF
jgi:FAD/FMN-containing dehydrogenase